MPAMAPLESEELDEAEAGAGATPEAAGELVDVADGEDELDVRLARALGVPSGGKGSPGFSMYEESFASCL